MCGRLPYLQGTCQLITQKDGRGGGVLFFAVESMPYSIILSSLVAVVSLSAAGATTLNVTCDIVVAGGKWRDIPSPLFFVVF